MAETESAEHEKKSQTGKILDGILSVFMFVCVCVCASFKTRQKSRWQKKNAKYVQFVFCFCLIRSYLYNAYSIIERNAFILFLAQS